MKNTDIAGIILIAAISMIVAYFVADTILGKPAAQSAKVKSVDTITSGVESPEASVFNKDAINPTVEVIIGQTAGQVRR